MEEDGFRIRKIGKRGKITIWLVHGHKIRSDLDVEFTNLGHHFRFTFIPEYEFWIDQEAVPDERRFFIDHLLTEWRLMKKGETYAQANKIASVQESSERERTRDYHKTIKAKADVRAKKVHLRPLKKLKKGLVVWLVDGRLVRSIFKVSFTEGGHDLVYRFIPKNEVWIDNDLIVEERPYIIFHELFERFLMAKDFSYAQAHRKASQFEWRIRYDPEKLNDNLALFGWKRGVV